MSAPRERYTHGHHRSVVGNHSLRTAADSAAFLTGRLSPHMRLLDLGCGPGSITLDLAGLVNEVVGIDAAIEAIDHARAAQESRGVDNASFVTGDVYELPFDDGGFDVVFAHQLLQHLSDPVRALREARRVVRPGGLIAARDADYGTMVHDPHDRRIDRWLDLYHRLARANGGEPDAGRMLAGWFTSAGLVELTVTTSTWTYHDRETVMTWRDLWVSRLTVARFGELAVETGMADQVELDDMADGWEAWAASPTAFFAFLHGEVVAVT